MASVVDKTFQILLRGYVENGHAPHYTEIAHQLGCSPAEARQALLDTMSTPGVASWLHPGTDIVASVAPFYSLASQYRVSVDGEQKWYAQCGFEATAVCWVFPGRTVRIDAACLDCNEPLSLVMRDGQILELDPSNAVGHLNQPVPWYLRDRRIEDVAYR
jgi:hypothetical protein